MRRFLFLLIFSIFLNFPNVASAQSPYVLPYPGTMPGSKLYVFQEIKNTALQYWYFGNYGQFTYHLKQSDKYLVEAKTLFEYKQYLLAYSALQKSDKHFQKTPHYLQKAAEEKRDISEKKKILEDAALKHREVLDKLEKELPDSFTWTPEKREATQLDLKKGIENSIHIRRIGL